MTHGFYFDAESCIGCRTCQVACKDAHDLPVGVNYRIVQSFCSGSSTAPRLYHLSLARTGCTLCAELRAAGGNCACVSACPMRAIEFGDLEELRAAHAGELLASTAAPLENAPVEGPRFIMRMKDCMADPDYDEILV